MTQQPPNRPRARPVSDTARTVLALIPAGEWVTGDDLAKAVGDLDDYELALNQLKKQSCILRRRNPHYSYTRTPSGTRTLNATPKRRRQAPTNGAPA